MSTILIPSNTLRDAKRLFGRLKHLCCKLPLLRHLLLTAGPDGIHLAEDQPKRVADMPALLEQLITKGRSTPGAAQANDVEVKSFVPQIPLPKESPDQAK